MTVNEKNNWGDVKYAGRGVWGRGCVGVWGCVCVGVGGEGEGGSS